MEIIKYPAPGRWDEICTRPAFNPAQLIPTVQGILKEVKEGGDEALLKYSEKFDKVRPENLRVGQQEIEEAENEVPASLKSAIEVAIRNITKFHASQTTGSEIIETSTGVFCWQKAVPIEKVGLYVPGGSAPLFSTVLMLGIPAKIAGCEEIVLCSPPNKEGKIHPAVLYAAHKIGVTGVYKLGGAQAIGAMAYGTESVPKVYKIFGPGNQYVTAAKQAVSLEGTGIDMPAGPSEVAVIADHSANPDFVAADLLAQAEHGPDSQVMLITMDDKLIDKVLKAIDEQLKTLPRAEVTSLTLENSKAILCKDIEEAIHFSNAYAPEHLIIATGDFNEVMDKITNAGSVFLGHYTPESAGDYASGTNHTLPTNGYARIYGGVNLDAYVKKITFQEVTREGLKLLGPVIEEMAAAESLNAHEKAVSIRTKKNQ